MRQADLKVTPGRHPFRRMVSNTERRVNGFAIVFPDGTQALCEGGEVTAVSICGDTRRTFSLPTYAPTSTYSSSSSL